MLAYTTMQLREAQDHAMGGGLALHLHTIIVHRDRAPACFVRAVDRGEWIAHLFGQDEAELRATVTALGVNVIVVERRGQRGQHIDLCGQPLRKALAMCENRRAVPARPVRRVPEEPAGPPEPSLFDLIPEPTT